MTLEKTFESSFDLKEIQSVHSKGNQSWIFLGSTDVEAETPTVWLPDAKSWLIWKDPDTGLTSKLSWWKIHLQWRRPWFDSWVWKTHWRRDRLPTPVFSGFPWGSPGKESACNVGDLGLILGLGRCSGEGNGNLLQYSCLENPMDRGTWQVTFHGVTKNQIQLSGFTFTFFPSAFALLAIYC